MTSRNARLEELAAAAAVQVHWRDAAGEPRTVAPDVLRSVLTALGLPCVSAGDVSASLQRLRHERRTPPPLITGTLGQPVIVPGAFAARTHHYVLELEHGARISGTLSPHSGAGLILPPIAQAGYHRLSLEDRDITVAIAPARCASVAECCPTESGKPWGLAAQLYSLRDDWAASGAGDYSALARLARGAARCGCQALAISPVHAMFSALPDRYSPYSPSSRLFLNTLYIDPLDTFSPDALGAALRARGDHARHREPAGQPLIDWPEIAHARLTLLRELYRSFPENVPVLLYQDYLEFRRRSGATLERHARFEALHARFLLDGAYGWRQWPAAYHEPDGDAVLAYARGEPGEVGFHAFLQWLAHRGLRHAHEAATDAGMGLGLMTDLAVGTDPGGSHAWSRQEDVIVGLSPGAPPDLYNAAGQSWGLATFSPRALRQRGYAAYLEMLRASLAHAGGVRIDHAMGLERMWLVPEGAHPRDGAYVGYPFEDLMRLTALESSRHRAVVMGENLGTVPHGFNERIRDAGMLGMSVLWFERGADGISFRRAANWSADSIATTSTHDLPTVAGWWNGRDVDWQASLGRLEADAVPAQRTRRAHERQALWDAVRPPHAQAEAPAQPPLDETLAWLGSTPAPLALVPLEDLLGMVEQPNLPGTLEEHPNWQRRLELSVQQIFRDRRVLARLERLAQARLQA